MEHLKLLCLLAFLCVLGLGTLPASAQTGSITGTVVDSLSNELLPGANVVIDIDGTLQGTSTDAEGAYRLTELAPGTYDLRATFIGYEDKVISDVRVLAGETAQIDFALAPSTLLLEEIVAVGYGMQRREEVTSAISRVSGEDFIEGAARDAAEMIEGQVAGLSISQSSGDPTGGSNISLRGTTTILAPSEPLVLIDGVPGDLDTVAPQQIESIDVLKGGSAAAIYGSRASNGVILITTKQSAGGSPTIRYSGFASYQQITGLPDVLEADDVRRLIDEGRWENSILIDHGDDTNWMDEVLRNPVSHTHNLDFFGGDANTRYRASLNYENSEGIFLRSNNEEVVGQVNVNHSMFDGGLQADLNLTSRLQTYWTGGDGFSFNTNVWNQAMIRNPTDRIKDEEGNWQVRPRLDYANPLSLLHESNGENEERELRLNGTLTWRPIGNLSLRLLGATTTWTQVRGYSETYQHISTLKNGLNGYASRGTGSVEEQLMEATATYDTEVANHDFNVLGGYSWQRNVNEDYFMQNFDFPTDQLAHHSIEDGSALTDGRATLNSGKEAWRLIGFFGRINYDYNNRYILMGSLRYEGNSKFGTNHRWGAFPAISAGWRLSEERFMDGVSFVDELKLRIGFGVTGIAPNDPYQSLASFTYGARFFSNGEWVQGLEPARNANPDLRWERKEELNVGLDFALLSRFSGSLDVYRRDTKDLLFNYSVPVPPYLFNTITANVGHMRNEGIEAALSYDVKRAGKLRWSTDFNFSTNRNKLLSLSNDQFQTENNFFYTGGIGGEIQRPTHRIFIGGPVGDFYGYRSVDINENGEWIIEDPEGNLINYFDRTEDDRQVIGNGVPKYHLSWNHSLRYGNVDFRMVMGGAFGYQILNFTRMFYENPTYNLENYLESAFEPVYGKVPLNVRAEYMSYYLEDGDHWKIENVTLGYSLGPLAGAISNARVYVSGRNLYTFTGYSGLDPEVNTSGLSPGNDSRFKYPTTRTFTLGMNLTF